jgi:hypothetical protein
MVRVIGGQGDVSFMMVKNEHRPSSRYQKLQMKLQSASAMDHGCPQYCVIAGPLSIHALVMSCLGAKDVNYGAEAA